MASYDPINGKKIQIILHKFHSLVLKIKHPNAFSGILFSLEVSGDEFVSKVLSSRGLYQYDKRNCLVDLLKRRCDLGQHFSVQPELLL